MIGLVIVFTAPRSPEFGYRSLISGIRKIKLKHWVGFKVLSKYLVRNCFKFLVSVCLVEAFLRLLIRILTDLVD